MKVEISKVPENIRDQFGSEETTALLLDLNERLSVSNLRAIPRALFLLETKALPAHDFVQFLVEDVKLTEKEALAVTREIKERVLEPMRYALFQWGVDISDIKVHDAPALKEILPEGAEEKSEEKSIEITEIGGEGRNVPIPIQKTETETFPAKKTETAPNTPFILHEEKKTETAAGEKSSFFKSFSVPLGFFKSKSQSGVPAASSTPIRARVEAPAKNEKRVVNYSELRTSLSPFEGKQSFLNVGKDEPAKAAEAPMAPALEKKEVPAPSMPELQPKPAVLPPAEKKEELGKAPIFGTIKKTEPKVEGNILDLS